ncbi:sigma-54-dependent Fis family transcriptional regulator [Neobacillus cucumis]|uniref:Sigma-54-dependent Fis family transcriptional regulator n=1 Tax=Neobacillus cucumis TaxID=1740721 RepID=A0A2N5HN59_9BACI|nr:sigma-54-dependent Fis family transcriptional regulator [Neobacillus cucumis]PLS06949.1 sigma-54-dependent Fis family transcriptional regulator [Neobacillus cucumis]
MIVNYRKDDKQIQNLNSTDPVWKWMTTNPYTVLPNQTLREAVTILQTYRIDGLPVVNELNRVVGLITRTRLMSCFLEGLSPDSPISNVMTKSVVTIEQNETITKAYELPVGRLPVVDVNGRLVGVLTRTDILHSYAKHIGQLQQTLHIAETLSTILESAYEGIVVIDANGYISEFNHAYSRFIGKKREEVLGQHVTQIIENTRLHVVIQTGVAEKGYIQRIQGQDMVVHRIPIWRERKVVGAIGMIIFHGVTELYDILGRMQELSRQVSENAELSNILYKEMDSFDQIIGQSSQIQAVKRIARKVARTPSTVLITGESGTGKEMFATAIHELSPYAEGPFISVNCAAIPEHLLEAELFGYEEGAFTGAKKGGKPGKFELAHKGTIFLDEIGDMPLFMQSKILRVLQEREVERVGGIAKHKIDVRIVAATNQHLEEMVAEGKFREDLYYRLNIIRLEIPPLRERQEDIPELLNQYLHQFSDRFGFEQKTFSREAMAALVHYPWPGNVRELVNTVEMLVSLSETVIISELELPPKIRTSRLAGIVSSPDPIKEKGLLTDIKDSVWVREKEIIIQALLETKGNKAAAARKLGIQRSTLYEKIKKYDIRP